MKDFFKNIKQTLAPFKGIILFLAAMFGANILWKLTIIGEEDADLVLLFNRFDISAFFLAASRHVAQVVYFFAHIFENSLALYDKTILYPDNHGVFIIWGCTGIKQSFIFLAVMLVARGDWQKKLWFIPLGLVLCYVINIVRIMAIVLIVEKHPELFKLFHTCIFKYIYYGLIFLIWLWWEEVLVKKKINPQINTNKIEGK
ncbi:MAG: archaeosortase/exosortase family protein [Prevotellaceae bacterium]|jgi:exosortase/archaeosortase family protein|nr:archaeosortase/exosortase family protein [Prevotellaceae bacterium]